MAQDNPTPADESAPEGATAAPDSDLERPEVEDFSDESKPDAGEIDPSTAVEMLGDVDLDVKIELGRCRMQVGDVLRLRPGSVVELDKLAGDPVDVYVNERLVARGEVLVVNDNFCVRVNDVLAAEADDK